MECKYKRILPVYRDLNDGTTWSLDTQSLGFEPDEVRLLQYGASNNEGAHAFGIINCTQLKDFFLIICCPANSSVSSQAKMSCPSGGSLSSLEFKFTVSGSGAVQAAQDMDVFMVLEFLKR